MSTVIDRKQRKAKFSKNRISSPFLSNEALLRLQDFEEELGISVPGLLAQLGEAARNGKPTNWHRAVAAFQDAIER